MDILVAEDSDTSLTMLTILLEKWQFKVVACKDGRLAWEAYQAGDFRIVISDWTMPEMDGIELCQAIRNCRGRDYCYFVLLTARSGKENLIYGLDAGADDYLAKPARPDELRARLRVAERVLAMQGDIKHLRQIMPICAWCKSIRNDTQLWSSVENYITNHDSVELTHSMCPDCLNKQVAVTTGALTVTNSVEAMYRLPRML
ncbi:MAG: response regulator [Blastocatellia bacterium]